MSGGLQVPVSISCGFGGADGLQYFTLGRYRLKDMKGQVEAVQQKVMLQGMADMHRQQQVPPCHLLRAAELYCCDRSAREKFPEAGL